MNQTYQNLRSQLRGHFIDYLKADHVGYWPPALTVCPKCHRSCGIQAEILWYCEACDLRGDVVDYVMINNSFDTPEKAIHHLCRMLGIRSYDMSDVSDNIGHIALIGQIGQGTKC